MEGQEDDGLHSAGKTTQADKMKPSYKHIPHSQKPPHLVAKRNARERRRVQAVNQAFYKLRKSVPIENRNKRVSKVKTLQRAIDYIRKLEMILAEDEAQGGAALSKKQSGAALLMHPQGQQAGFKQSSDGPLQAKTESIVNLASGQDGAPAARASQPTVAGRSQRPQEAEGATACKESRAKRRPSKSELGPDEFAMVKRQQRVAATSTTQKQRRGRKPNASKLLTGDLQHSNHQPANHQQLARDPQVQCVQGGFDLAPLAANGYDQHKPAAGRNSGGPTAAPAIGSLATNLYLPASSSAAVSYGRPHGATSSQSGGHHYSSNHYHYYADSSAADQHHAAYISHLQLPAEAQQQTSGEISTSRTANNFCGYTQNSAYHYGDIANCSPLLLDPDRAGNNPQTRLMGRPDSFMAVPTDGGELSSSAPNQHAYSTLADVGRHHLSTWPSSQATGVVSSELAHNKVSPTQDKPASKAARTEESLFAPARSSPNSQLKRNEFARKHSEAAQSMPADSTSCMQRAPYRLSQSKPPMSIGSPPISICSSSSSLSPSTTLKSLDLSGASSGAGSAATSSTIFGSLASNRSDKSPTTTSGLGAPVVCRQHSGANNSNHDSGAHSTTARDYLSQAQTNNRLQQVNNYGDQPGYVAHFSYENPPSGNGGYHSLEGPLGEPAEQRTIKSISGAQNESRPSAASLHAAGANSGLRYQSGSRSSADISGSQLPPAPADYLTNNTLHADGRHTSQLFQQHQRTYYQPQHRQHQQLHHQHHHHQHQHSPYQGQQFLGNQHGLQPQHNSAHLSDHRSHHIQSESLSSSELRQRNTNTVELITTTNIIGHHQQSSPDQLVVNSSSATNSAPAQYTVLPL